MNRYDERCGTCRYHTKDVGDGGDWICENPNSENEGLWTEYDDTCDDYEER